MEAFLAKSVEENFRLPLSVIASDQLLLLEEKLLPLQAHVQEDDQWSYLWGPLYTSKKAYKSLVATASTPPQFTWLWKSSCRGKHKFFLLVAGSRSPQICYEESICILSPTTVFCVLQIWRKQ